MMTDTVPITGMMPDREENCPSELHVVKHPEKQRLLA